MAIIFAQLHEKNRTTNHFILDLKEHVGKILFLVDKTNSFSASSLGMILSEKAE
jgi:hypothetical protein